MSEKGTSLAQYVEHFGLEILNHGDTYETDKVESTNVNRPDLQILGLFDYFDARRIQVMGKAELTYIMKMSENRADCGLHQPYHGISQQAVGSLHHPARRFAGHLRRRRYDHR